SHDAVAEPGKVLDQRRQHQLTTGFESFDEKRTEIGAGGIERGSQTCGARADDDALARSGHQSPTCRSMTFLSSSFGVSPAIDSATWPALKSSIAGMPRIWNLNAVFGLSSTFSLPMVTRPAYSLASASMVGASRLQGPHHSAQKSTSTNEPGLSTVS